MDRSGCGLSSLLVQGLSFSIVPSYRFGRTILAHTLATSTTISMARNLSLQGETTQSTAYKVIDADLTRAIRDSDYKHALRLYRDRSTGAMRLEASVLNKEMKEYVPVKL